MAAVRFEQAGVCAKDIVVTSAIVSGPGSQGTMSDLRLVRQQTAGRTMEQTKRSCSRTCV